MGMEFHSLNNEQSLSAIIEICHYTPVVQYCKRKLQLPCFSG